MTRQSDADYLAARLRAELRAAASATDEQVRAAHEALAEFYRARLADFRDAPAPAPTLAVPDFDARSSAGR